MRFPVVGRARQAVPVVVPVLVVVQVRPVAGKDKAVRRVAPVLAAVKALPVLTVRRVPVDVMGTRHPARAEAPVRECPQAIRTMLQAALQG